MKNKKNGHGLSRHIPAEIMRQIRRYSRFACVVCRCGIAQYEHIDPPFSDAKKHDPNRICLLCGACHDKATRGILSKETIIFHYDRIRGGAPAKEPFDELDLRDKALKIKVGTVEVDLPKRIIEVDGITLLAIDPPDSGSTFPTLTGVLTDNAGREVFKIVKNRWKGSMAHWDLQVVGPQITIRATRKEIALQILLEPPDMLSITKLNMRYRNAHILVRDKEVLVGRLSPRGGLYLAVSGARFFGERDSVISVDTRRLAIPATIVPTITPYGITLKDTGIVIGSGHGGCSVRGFGFATRGAPDSTPSLEASK